MCVIFTSSDSHVSKFVEMLVCLMINFTCLEPTGSLSIAIKPKTTYKSPCTAILVYIRSIQKIITTKVFLKLKLSTTRHEGVWVERRYSSYSFLTSPLDGVSGQRHAPAAL
jgi:hypothetical protein